MPFYPPEVQKRFDSPQRGRTAEFANAEGRSASFQCGSFVAFSLRIDADSKVVSDAGFRSNGCGYMIAAADVLAQSVEGRKLSDLHGLNANDTQLAIAEVLIDVPDDRKQCIDVCIEAVSHAFAGFRATQIEESAGETALVCTCFGMTEKAIEGYLNAGTVKTVDDISRLCNAGSGCGSCRMLIQEMIDVISDKA